jgi:hypothetical protein
MLALAIDGRHGVIAINVHGGGLVVGMHSKLLRLDKVTEDWRPRRQLLAPRGGQAT